MSTACHDESAYGWNDYYGTKASWNSPKDEDEGNAHDIEDHLSSNSKTQLERSGSFSDEPLFSHMANTIYVAYRDPTWYAKESEHRLVEPKEFRKLPAQDLSEWISYQIPVGDKLTFEKIVILKEDDLVNLRKRLREFLKQEDCKMVNFGIFSTAPIDKVVQCFAKSARSIIRRDLRAESLGRIWSMEVNGTGKGCGLIAADDKIHTWTDQFK